MNLKKDILKLGSETVVTVKTWKKLILQQSRNDQNEPTRTMRYFKVTNSKEEIENQFLKLSSPQKEKLNHVLRAA